MTERLLPLPGDDGGLNVRGGVGGIRFQWEELEEASRVLEGLAADAGEVALALGITARDVRELPWRVLHLDTSGGGWFLHQEALSQVDAASASVRSNGEELEGTKDRLVRNLRTYRAADAVALAATEAVRMAGAEAARRAARVATAGGAVVVGPVLVEPGERSGAVTFDGSVSGVLDRLSAVEAARPGSFEILTAGTAERPVHVVVLPGTQTGTVDGRAGSNPFDVGGIAEALTEDSRYTEEAVRVALAEAGARQGDGVIIAGYSQGGLHAVNLAGPERLGSFYDVQLVLTVGSPTGWEAPEGGEYLHLEHGRDGVPNLDASANGDGRNRTTVSFDHEVPALGVAGDGTPEPWGLGPAHKLENYAEGARLVDASDAPSLAPAAALLAAAGAGGTARRHSFTAVRPPRDAAPMPARPRGRRGAV